MNVCPNCQKNLDSKSNEDHYDYHDNRYSCSASKERATAITPPEIPDSHTEFAKAIAEAAVKHGIDRFTMTFRPDFAQGLKQDRRIHGDFKIHFSNTDGRGRPCHNLRIELESTLAVQIESNPESFN